MRALTLPIALFALLVSACQSAPHSLQAKDGVRTAPIRGSAFFLERMMPPPDAVLEIQLTNDHLTYVPTPPIAKQNYEHLHGPPYEFTLSYDPTRIEAGEKYSLTARLLAADGSALFVTQGRVPVTIGSKEVISFRIVRAP
jgi:putative lipoprotein